MPTDDSDTQQEADRQRFLAEASHLLSSSLDYTETLQRLAQLAVPRVADWCAIYITNAEGRLEPVEVAHPDAAQRQLAMDMRRRHPPDPASDYGAYHVLRTGRSEMIREVTNEMIRASNLPADQIEVLEQLGFRSAMTVPLRARGRTFGVIQFVSSGSGRLFNHEDLAFAEDFAARAALATDNARLFQLSQRRQREEAALRAATEAVTASHSVDDIIRQIATSAIAATEADGSFVERIRGEDVEVVAVGGRLHPPLGERESFEGSVAQRVVESNQPELIRQLSEHPQRLPGVLGGMEAEARALAVPLVDGGEAIGALVLLRDARREPFTKDEAERAHSFGNLAALAFRKVHLLEDTERRREELEQVIKSRSRLMRGFTHDLKNPIGAADGHAALLEDGLLGQLSDEQVHSVRRIRASLDNALKLIDALNEFARAETGRIEIRQAPVQLIEIARELGEQYRGIAAQKGLAVDLELHKVPIITSDDDRIRQILGNLLSNAVKFTNTEGRITMRTDVRPNEHGEC
ncbi:MAG TPA: GAF domain-containing sensor histidine kinase, partial [Burkholderiales bacterium]|nr:GAF domain-containing sensor histidine kinase [Burkholderiales bacterium]